ncbi:transporter [Methylobacterium variabile]|uniref:Transporter n=1 Tax=Methylobacterium variabile TaxID=298794 RepID=A0A0J6T4A9_9HYPH|nr:autotransporter outer membrane beta-barrel domain-containing protein [Methylobacterium variabile]KMO40799.1 transporter [Methylobacterium variabile]
MGTGTSAAPKAGRSLARLRSALLLGASFAALPVVGVLTANEATAQAIAPGFNSNRLPGTGGDPITNITAISADGRTLDGVGGPVNLPFSVNYFGRTYNQIFVNNHGNLTFDSASAAFVPFGVGADYRGQPIIAPFLADTDTRNPQSGVLGFGTGTYQGRTAFGATWPNVGYFDQQADKTNSFQAILASRSDTGTGNFDIYFNYGSIKWECSGSGGQGGANGFCGTTGTAPSVGFSAGTGEAGTYYQLPGSLVAGAFLDGGPNALATGTNNGVPGQFLFPVRNGTVLIASVCSPGDNASTTTAAVCGPDKAYNQGIFYTPTGPFTLTVRENTTIAAPATTAAILVTPASTSGAVPSANVTINVAASASITSADRAGIQIDSTKGTGTGTVDTAGTITAGTAGVLAQTNVGALRVTNSGSITAPFGILGESVTTTLTNTGTIKAGVGMAAQAGVATISNAGTVTFGTAGLAAVTSGGVLTNTGTLTYDGSIADPFAANVLDGLPTLARSINLALTQVTQGSGPTPTGMAGLSQGDLTVSNSGTITGGAIGIAALAQGALSLQNTGTITSGGTGVAAQAGVAAGEGTSARAGTLTFSNSGAISAAGGPAALLRTYGGSLTVANSGTLGGLVGLNAAVVQGAAGSALTISNATGGSIVGTSGLAIDTSASSIASRIDNRGTITGAVNLSAGSSVANSGQFNATGTSGFGGGVFNNLGTLSVVPGATRAANVTLGGLSEFRNAGTISLVNGRAGDTLTIQGNYVGQNGRIDTEFLTQTGIGDQVVIAGNASGSTSVNVTNLSSAVPFSTATPFVVVRGTSQANAFTLGTLQNFGTLQAALVSATGAEGTAISVAAVPNAVALSAPTAVIASRTIAFQGGTAVLDRMTQLRTDAQRAASGTPSIPQAMQYAGLNQYAALVTKDPIAPNLVQPVEPPPSNVRPAVWARAYGDLERRTGSTSFSFAGTNFFRDLGYSQSGGGLLGGADLVISRLTKEDDGLILGVMGGYTTASVRLNQAAGRQDYEGGTIGVYGTYLNGPWFWDHLFKVDLLGLDIRAPGLLQRTGLQNYAYTTNVGYRIPLQNALYVEPTAGLEYVATTFNQQAALTATSVPLRDGDALRGRIGARVGSEFVEGDIRVEPSVTGFVYSVLTESGVSGAVNGITGVTGLREQGKVRGEVQASVNFFNLKTGLSGFVRADYRIGGDLVGGGGRVGMRYQW